jgi:NADH-quinone oxidoreductase subunit N
MNWSVMLTAMLPEHLLLAGIVVLISMDVAGISSRGSAAVALLFTLLSTLAAALLALSGFEGAPFPGHFSVDPPTLMANAIVLALATPILHFSRR